MSNEKEDIRLYQGTTDILKTGKVEEIKSKIEEFSKIKNIHFLLGAGTSSGSIPAMSEMKEALEGELSNDNNLNHLYETFTSDNLEVLLGAMYAKKHYLEELKDTQGDEKDKIITLIEYVEKFIYKQINIKLCDTDTLELYKGFYQKIALRNKDLARVNIFTTNNDFGGGLERVFNPARFHYTFSQKIDANLEKFEPIENMVYLYKLHGSISWIEKKSNSLFNIQEVAVKSEADKENNEPVLIYPTPLKQGQSLGSPYSDLIREFQTKLQYKHSVLFIIGYSFSDEHINNIIYQSLKSNASLIIVIFGEYKGKPLSKINDSRIYRIFGEVEEGEIHYFEYIVNNLLPSLDENKEQTLLKNFIKALKEEDK